jgi:hypothetical protein
MNALGYSVNTRTVDQIDTNKKIEIMKIIVKLVLVLIFCISTYMVFDFGGGLVSTGNGFIRPGYVGGAIGFGLIASSSLLGFIYFECNCDQKKSL